MADPADDPVVRELRDRITEADREILAGINRRIELVRELHAYKLERGYPLRDPGREEALLGGLAEENPGPLSREGLREIYGAIVAEWQRQPAAAPVSPDPER
jgi:chorismate mutase